MKASMKKMGTGGKMKKMMTGGMANPNKSATVSSGPSTGVVPGMNKNQPKPGNSFPTRKAGGAMKKMKTGGMVNPNKMQPKTSEKAKTSMVTYTKGGMKKMGKKK